jgi:plasmid stabilization system protein ParE
VGAIVFTERADADLFRLRAFLLQASPRAAASAAKRIVEGLDLLAMFPRAGVLVRGNVRRLIVKHGRAAYIVRYQIEGEDIHVLRIWHSRERRR